MLFNLASDLDQEYEIRLVRHFVYCSSASSAYVVQIRIRLVRLHGLLLRVLAQHM